MTRQRARRCSAASPRQADLVGDDQHQQCSRESSPDRGIVDRRNVAQFHHRYLLGAFGVRSGPAKSLPCRLARHPAILGSLTNGECIRNPTFTADCQNDGFVPISVVPLLGLGQASSGTRAGVIERLIMGSLAAGSISSGSHIVLYEVAETRAFLRVPGNGAQKRTRTSTTLRSPAPEAGASTNSAIWARELGKPG